MFLILFGCWVTFGISMIAIAVHVIFVVVTALAFLGFAGCVLLMLLALRCPNCRNNLGYAVQWPVSWGVSDRIKYCPFCGVSLDALEEDILTDESSMTS